MKVLNQETEMVEVDRIQPHPSNPNLGDLESIAESIETNDWYGFVVAQRSTGNIIAGSHRWMVAREKEVSSIPVLWLDVDDEHAIRIMLADNETTRRGEYDTVKLLENLQLFADVDFAGTGFTRESVALQIEKAGLTPTTEHDVDSEFAYNQKAVDLQGDLLREGAAMREIVLALPKADAEVFAGHVEDLMRFWKTNAVREVVQRSVRECSERIPPEERKDVNVALGTATATASAGLGETPQATPAEAADGLSDVSDEADGDLF